MSELTSLQELREWMPFEKKVIKEQRDGRVLIVMEGILQRADTLNQNGRIYPRAILDRELRNYQKIIGELGCKHFLDQLVRQLPAASMGKQHLRVV